MKRLYFLVPLILGMVGYIGFADEQLPIVDFEFSGFTNRTDTLISQFGATVFQQSLWADFLLIAGYTATFWLLSNYAASFTTAPKLAKFAKIGMAAALVAGICDVVENTSLLLGLSHGNPWLIVGAVFAVLKFIAFTLAAVSAIWALLTRTIDERRN